MYSCREGDRVQDKSQLKLHTPFQIYQLSFSWRRPKVSKNRSMCPKTSRQTSLTDVSFEVTSLSSVDQINKIAMHHSYKLRTVKKYWKRKDCTLWEIRNLIYFKWYWVFVGQGSAPGCAFIRQDGNTGVSDLKVAQILKTTLMKSDDKKQDQINEEKLG